MRVTRNVRSALKLKSVSRVVMFTSLLMSLSSVSSAYLNFPSFYTSHELSICNTNSERRTICGKQVSCELRMKAVRPQTNQCRIDSERTIRELNIEKQSAFLELYQIQEQKLVTLKELAILNEFAIEGSVKLQQLKLSKVSDEQPWDPRFLDIDSYTYSNVMRRQVRRNQLKAFAVSIKDEIKRELVRIYQWDWMYTHLCQSNWMRSVDFENRKAGQYIPSSSEGQLGFDDREDQIGEMVDTLTETEGNIQNLWDQTRDLEESLDVFIQSI